MLIEPEGNSLWRSTEPIACTECKEYRVFMYGLGDDFFCIDCMRDAISEELLLGQKNEVFIRGVICPTNTKETRQRERGLMTLKLRWEIIKRDNFRCIACGSNNKLEVDHIVPISKGGKTEKSNLQTLCWECNRGKGNG